MVTSIREVYKPQLIEPMETPEPCSGVPGGLGGGTVPYALDVVL